MRESFGLDIETFEDQRPIENIPNTAQKKLSAVNYLGVANPVDQFEFQVPEQDDFVKFANLKSPPKGLQIMK